MHHQSYVELIVESTVSLLNYIFSWLILKYFLTLSVYVDSSDMCNDLGFNLGATGSTVSRSWTIKVFIQLTKKYHRPNIIVEKIFRLLNMIVISTIWHQMAALNTFGE